MADRVRTRVRQREPAAEDRYERCLKYLLDLRDRATTRAVVLRGKEMPWEQTRQGRLQWFIVRETDDTNSVLRDWDVFIHDIRVHSGKHRHQGGLIIYVLEGQGYTEVDDERVEWEAGDLLLLPIQPGGVTHKHYNRRPGESCKWMAFIYRPYMDEIGYYIEQKEQAPDYQ
jgi:mannose-6-phosphate isomerase-like protein (cupin superfamily)